MCIHERHFYSFSPTCEAAIYFRWHANWRNCFSHRVEMEFDWTASKFNQESWFLPFRNLPTLYIGKCWLNLASQNRHRDRITQSRFKPGFCSQSAVDVKKKREFMTPTQYSRLTARFITKLTLYYFVYCGLLHNCAMFSLNLVSIDPNTYCSSSMSILVTPLYFCEWGGLTCESPFDG